MSYIRYILLSVAIVFYSLFGTPNTSTAFQLSTDGGSRVITLSSTGQDIANAVAYSADGKWLAAGTSSGVSVFDTQELSQVQFFNTGVWARSVTFSPDGQVIAAGLFDGTARFWHLAEGQEIQTITGHDGWVRSVAFSSDGVLFATAADDDTVRIWDVESGVLKIAIPDLQGVRILAFSPDGDVLAAGLQDAIIQLLNTSNGGLVKTLKGHEDWVRSLAFSPDGKSLASGAFDATAIIWDVASGRMKYALADHQASVLGVSFSPDGTTFATGSVDSTVKLWNVADGSLIRTLVGHTDFVYSVAFSPDGRTIASGSSDNSVRFWDLNDSNAGDLPQPATPSDCQACHHPIGLAAPPRVIQVSCEACHVNGIGLNWCPFFPRSAQAISDTTYFPPTGPVGLPISSENLAVKINYPTNGETLYVTGHNLSPVFVVGRVFYRGNQGDINIRLEIWSGGQMTKELFTQPDQDGAFTFKLAINPDGDPVVAGAKAADPDCAACHEDFQSQASFPDGQVHFVVTAISPNGDQALDERWVTVDVSRKVEVDVHVVDQENGTSIPDLSVRAAAVLYEWRDRYAGQVSNADGIASLSLEALSQTATRYEINVPPTSLNGYLYESVESVFLDLSPGALGHESVTVFVEVKTGQITGKLSGAQVVEPLDIWAVHLPDGAYHKVSAINEVFSFEDLPSSEYQVFVDPGINLHGYHAEPIRVDLTKESQAIIDIELEKNIGVPISGNVYAEDGSLLPFGWIAAASEKTSQLDPVSGDYQLFGLDSAKVTVIANVPGYYSQAQVVDLSDEQHEILNFSLVRMPETKLISWGDGTIIIPSETVYEENQEVFTLQNGWIWGENGKDDTFNIQVAGRQITLRRGSFAIEYQPPQGGWLYLFEGEASIQTAHGIQVHISGGEMVALSSRDVSIPVPYEETVIMSFQHGQKSPFDSKWEPTLEAQIRDRLAQTGISIAQVITFVTYLLVLIVIAAFLIRGIYSIWKFIKR